MRSVLPCALLFVLFSLCLAAPAAPAKGPAKAAAKKEIVSGDWTIRWDDSSANAENKKSGAKVAIYKDEGDDSAASADGDDADGASMTRNGLLSVVGPIVSFTSTTTQRGRSRVTYSALDLSTGKPAKLSDWFPEAQLMAALSADKVFHAAMDDSQKAATLKALLESAGGGQYTLDETILSSFGFHHVKDGQLAVRIGLNGSSMANLEDFAELGIYLPIPEALKDAVEQAKANKSLMGNHFGK